MSKNKVNIDVFINKYNTYKSKDAKKNYLLSVIETNKYIDYLIKVNYAKNIISVSCMDGDGHIKVDSCKKYILYIQTVFSLYTKFEIPENFITEYDKLESNNIIEEILNAIPENELKTFNTILQMCQDDLFTNNYEIHSFINNKINEIYPYIAKVVSPVIKSIDEKINAITVNDIINGIANIINTDEK